eukprot:203506_1
MTAVVITFFCLLAVVLLVLVLWAARAMHRRELAARDSQIAGLTEQLIPQLPEDETGVTEDAAVKARVAEELNVELRTQIDGLKIERDESNESAQTAKSRVTELEGNVERLTTLEQSLNTEIAALTSASEQSDEHVQQAESRVTELTADLARLTLLGESQRAELVRLRIASEDANERARTAEASVAEGATREQSLSEELDALRITNAAAVQSAVELRTAATEREARLQELQASRDGAVQSAEELRTAATEHERIVRELEAERVQSDEHVQQAESRVTELTADLARLTLLGESQRAELVRLRIASEDANERARTAEASVAEGATREQSLSEELDALRITNAAAVQSAVELRTAATEREARLQELQASRDGAVQSAEELRTAATEHERIVRELEAERVESDRLVEEARATALFARETFDSRVAELESEKVEADTSLAALKRSHSDQLETLRRTSEETLVARVAELERAKVDVVHGVQDELDAANSQVEELTQAQAAASAESDRLAEVARENVSSAQATLAARVAELERAKVEAIQRVQEELDIAKSRVEDLTQAQVDASANATQRTEEFETARRQHESAEELLKVQIATLNTEKEAADSEVAELKSVLGKLAPKLETLEANFKAEVAKSTSQANDIRKLEGQITQMNSAAERLEIEHQKTLEVCSTDFSNLRKLKTRLEEE